MSTPAYTPLESVSALDDVIFQDESFFSYSPEHIRTFRDDHLTRALRYHWETSRAYRRYCEARSYELPGGLPDWSRVPLIPSLCFKEGEVLTGDKAQVVKRCESSGTKGSVSSVLRDDVTLNRFLGSINTTMEQLLGVDDAYCFNLGPSADEDPHLWFSYAMAAVAMLFPTTHCVVDGRTRFDLLYEEFEKAKRTYENVLIVGAPVMVLSLLDDMKRREISYEHCESLVTITAGGWKRFSGEALNRDELLTRLHEGFRGISAKGYRDILNLVELNTVLTECETEWKHVPPWVLVRTIDPRDLTDVRPGEQGLIGYLDASTTSYPGFLITDDIGILAEGDRCTCGRTGQRMKIIRRVTSEESRGCALKIDRDYSDSPSAEA